MALIVFFFGSQRILAIDGFSMRSIAGGLLLLLGVALAVVWWYRASWRESFALRGTRPTALLGACLIGFGGSLAVVYLQTLIMRHLPGVADQFDSPAVRKLTALIAETPLVLLLATLAVMPAVIEELLCRGVILQSLMTGRRRWLAMGLSSAIFAILHLDPAKYLPTFIVGMLAAWLVLRARSILAGMFMHASWNATIVVIGWRTLQLAETDPAAAAAATPSPAYFAIGSAVLIVGVLVFRLATPAPASENAASLRS